MECEMLRECEEKFGKRVPKAYRLFDEDDRIKLGQCKPATLHREPVTGGNRLGKIKFTTCVKSSGLGKRFGFAESDQQSAMSLEYTDGVGRMNREKCCSRVMIAVSMKKIVWVEFIMMYQCMENMMVRIQKKLKLK